MLKNPVPPPPPQKKKKKKKNIGGQYRDRFFLVWGFLKRIVVEVHVRSRVIIMATLLVTLNIVQLPMSLQVGL